MTFPSKGSENEDRPLFTIGVVAEMIGVTPATLRIWERKGLVSPLRRGKNRSYSRADLVRLQTIRRLLQERGMNIAGVRAVLENPPCWELKDCGEEKESCPVYLRLGGE